MNSLTRCILSVAWVAVMFYTLYWMGRNPYEVLAVYAAILAVMTYLKK